MTDGHHVGITINVDGLEVSIGAEFDALPPDLAEYVAKQARVLARIVDDIRTPRGTDATP